MIAPGLYIQSGHALCVVETTAGAGSLLCNYVDHEGAVRCLVASAWPSLGCVRVEGERAEDLLVLARRLYHARNAAAVTGDEQGYAKAFALQLAFREVAQLAEAAHRVERARAAGAVA